MLLFIISILISYCYLLLIAFAIRGWIKKNKAIQTEHSYPFCSVIVAARNEETNISHLCTCLQQQTYPNEQIEFIIINDHSQDNTLQVLQEFAAKDTRFIILDAPQESTGKKQALQFALSHAKGDLLLFTDADCIIPQNWIETYVAQYSQSKSSFLFGNVIPTLSSNSILERFFQLDFVGILAVQPGLAKLGHAFSCNGANMAISKQFYKNSYNTNTTYASGDDVFLLHTAKTKNRQTIDFIQEKEGAIKTSLPTTLRDFFKQRIRWASKSGGYKDFDAIAVAIIVYCICLAMTAFFIGMCCGSIHAIMCFCLLFITKTIADIAIFCITAKYYETKQSLWLIIPFQCFYFFYITIIPIFAMVISTQWKNRTINK
ncbi:MAG: glycosyltransferase [Bacteroidales bacterium]|nr:glycosyltransferase [Bacteroidales bacterium]